MFYTLEDKRTMSVNDNTYPLSIFVFHSNVTFCHRVRNDTSWKGLRQNKRKVCPEVLNFFAGHYVRKEVISAGHWAIIAGHCPMSGVYFPA